MAFRDNKQNGKGEKMKQFAVYVCEECGAIFTYTDNDVPAVCPNTCCHSCSVRQATKEDVDGRFSNNKAACDDVPYMADKSRKNDMVNHPSHYTFGKYEVLDVIEDWDLDYHRGNAVKYIARAGHKNPETEIEDLEKAVCYLNRKIKKLKEKKDEERNNG